MKKIILNSLFAVVATTSLSASDNYMRNEELCDLVGSNYANTATFFKGASWWLPVKYFAISAAPGAVLGGLLSEEHQAVFGFGLCCGVAGTIIVYVDRFVRVNKMNKFLKEYTPVSCFKELSDAQAVMLCGAHYKDLDVMKRLLPYLSDFLHEIGTWEVLTELYFDEPDSTVTHSGSSWTPGYSTRGGFSVERTSHNTLSQVKHAYMSAEAMKRRMKVLKAKLGYID